MTKQTKTLARFTPAQLERFLVEFANLQVEPDSLKRFQSRFAAFIPIHDPSWIVRLAEEKNEVANKLSNLIDDFSFEEIGNWAWIVTLKLMLLNLWTELDPRQKEWGAFGFRYAIYKANDDDLTSSSLFGLLLDPSKAFRVPPPTPFEQAISYLVKVGDKARYCPNPECPAPYFFVKRKNQRYCSEICAAPAQRELKRQWWAEHGEEWRTARQRKLSKKSTNKGKSGKKQTTKKGR